MNSHGVHVQQRIGRPIMSSLHTAWAFGGMLAAALAAADVDTRLAVATAAVLLVTLVLTAARRLGPGSIAEGDDAPAFTLPSRRVLLLAALCLLVMMTGGAMGNWGGLYLRDDLDAPKRSPRSPAPHSLPA
jgi:hypothetical protein